MKIGKLCKDGRRKRQDGGVIVLLVIGHQSVGYLSLVHWAIRFLLLAIILSTIKL